MEQNKICIDKIQQLRTLLELNLNCCEAILNFIDQKRKTPLEYTKFINTFEGAYLIINSNNHFFETISIFNSLLYPHGKEISPFNFLSLNLNQREELDKIKKEFKDK